MILKGTRTMKIWVFVIIGIMPILSFSRVVSGHVEPDSYIVNYDVLRKGKKRGLAQRMLRMTGSSSYSLTMQSDASLFFYSISTCEKSTFRTSGGNLVPLSYNKVDDRTFKKTKHSALHFSPEENLVKGSNGKNSWERLTENMILDPLLAYEAMRLDAKENKKANLTYPKSLF